MGSIDSVSACAVSLYLPALNQGYLMAWHNMGSVLERHCEPQPRLASHPSPCCALPAAPLPQVELLEQALLAAAPPAGEDKHCNPLAMALTRLVAGGASAHSLLAVTAATLESDMGNDDDACADGLAQMDSAVKTAVMTALADWQSAGVLTGGESGKAVYIMWQM